MAKANLCNEYKIPIKDRKDFMGKNKLKWVSKKNIINI